MTPPSVTQHPDAPAVRIDYPGGGLTEIYRYAGEDDAALLDRAMKSVCRSLGLRPADLLAEEDPAAPAAAAYLRADSARKARAIGLTAAQADEALLSLTAQRWAPGQNREAGLHAPSSTRSAA